MLRVEVGKGACVDPLSWRLNKYLLLLSALKKNSNQRNHARSQSYSPSGRKISRDRYSRPDHDHVSCSQGKLQRGCQSARIAK
jgi:hypothetical protein